MSPSRLTVEAWPVTDAGPAEENKDTVLIYEPTNPSVARQSGSLYVVVDGMGASSSGQLASRYTAQRIMDYFFNDAEPDLGLRLREAVQAANADLFAYSQHQPELVKLGATLVTAVIRGEELHVASVGDSRAYLIRDGQIEQITKDHTLVQQLIDEQAISPDEASDHPRRDVVLRSLGAEETVRVDIFDLRMRPDDALVLCSDALTRYLHADEIAMLVGNSSPRSAAEMLVRKALDRGGKDSVTVIAALVRDGAPAVPADTPHQWDGQPASFDPTQTMLRRRPETTPQAGPPPLDETIPSGVDVTEFLAGSASIGTSLPPEEQLAEDSGATIRHQALRREEPAPPYQPSVQPAPPFNNTPQQPAPIVPQQPTPYPPQPYPPAPQAYPPDQQQYGQRGVPRGYPQQPAQPAYSAPPGYVIDPVTGLPPVPPQGYGQPGYAQAYPGGPAYAPRVYQPPAQPQHLRQRRGIPLGRFIAAGIVAILLTVVMVIVLVNPLNWELPSLGGVAAINGTSGPGTQIAGGNATGEPGEQPTQQSIPTSAPTASGPTPTAPIQPPAGMVLVSGGAFMRGVSDEEATEWVRRCIDESQEEGDPACLPDYFADAKPVEMVTLSPFFIDITEVTNREYAACVASEVCTVPEDETFYADPNYAEHPVVYVTWQQAVDYCRWADKRLPTEAEWEMAARWDPDAQVSHVFPWGDGFEAGRANLSQDGAGGTAAVRAFAQDISPWAVIGMAGNVSEWVADWYFPGYNNLGTLNPTGPASQPLTDPERVVRGGSFYDLAAFGRSGHRLSADPRSAADWIGFRCAMEVSGAVTPPTPTPGAGAATLPASITPTPTETPVP